MKINQIIEAMSKDKVLQDFEKIFFGDLKKSPERDTSVEKEMYKAIYNYVEYPSFEHKKLAHDSLTHLLQIKQYYPDDLIPKAKIAYRGTQLGLGAYKKIIAQNKIDGNGWLNLDKTYKPSSVIQSWSTKKNIAGIFALNRDMWITELGDLKYNPKDPSVRYPGIISVNVDNTFVLTSKLTNLMSKLVHGDKEYEIIRVSKAPINGKVLIQKSWLQEWQKWYEKYG